MIAMVQKLFFYIVGILIIGLLFSGITSFILSYLPYLFAGLVLTLPIYGAVRKKIQKGKNIALVMASIIKGLKPSKKSVSTYLILLVVVAFTFDKLAIALFQSILAGIIAFVVAFCLWELVRFTLKVTKKVQFLSFGEAVKGAF